MKGLGIALAIVVLCGCQSSTRHTDVEDLKRRLVGQTTGGREGTWKFRSVEQIESCKIISEGPPLEAELVVHAKETGKRVLLRVRIEIDYWAVKSVGLLYIEEL